MSFRIGLLDSGSGGLSILKELQKTLPGLNYSYLCDNLYFPYGELESSFLVKRIVTESVNFVKKQQIDLLIIACNTASTFVLDQLREKLTIPIVGVVPAIKPAAELSKTGTIGIIATKITTKSQYLQTLIEDFASSTTVIKKASPRLVEISEQKVSGVNPKISEIEKEIKIFLEHPSLDTVVLGCTHFSLLLPEIKKIDTKNITWLDSREAIAKRVKSLIPIDKISNKKNNCSSVDLIFTKEDSKQKNNWERFLQRS